MASVQSSESWLAKNKVDMYDYDPADSTVITDVGWVDLQDYEEFTVMVFTSVLGGTGPTAFKLLANSSATGAGTDAEIKVHALGSLPNAVGDWVVLSCSAEEVRQAETTTTGRLRYVSANLDCNHSGDEAVVVYVRSKPRVATLALTTDVIS